MSDYTSVQIKRVLNNLTPTDQITLIMASQKVKTKTLNISTAQAEAIYEILTNKERCQDNP